MSICEIWSGALGTVVGFTQAYCIYRTDEVSELSVTQWRELALANICPADPLLPQDLAEVDRANTRAALLREFLAAEPFGLTATQAAAPAELTAILCGPQQL